MDPVNCITLVGLENAERAGYDFVTGSSRSFILRSNQVSSSLWTCMYIVSFDWVS
jgi:hypothetical protein